MDKPTDPLPTIEIPDSHKIELLKAHRIKIAADANVILSKKEQERADATFAAALNQTVADLKINSETYGFDLDGLAFVPRR